MRARGNEEYENQGRKSEKIGGRDIFNLVCMPWTIKVVDVVFIYSYSYVFMSFFCLSISSLLCMSLLISCDT